MASIKDCKIIDLPTTSDDRGRATFVAEKKDIPFEIHRVYYLYGVPRNKVRGLHAHIREKQVVVAINGSLDVVIDDGKKRKTVKLSSPMKGLYIAPMIWREFKNFSKGVTMLTIVDDFLDEKEYIRNYDDFKRVTNKRKRD